MLDRSIPKRSRARGEPGTGGQRCYEVVKRLAELTEPSIRAQFTLPQLLDREFLADRLTVYGYSRRQGKRVRIDSPWRREVFLDLDVAGSAKDGTEIYTDVLLYEQTKAKSHRDTAKTKADLRAFLEAEAVKNPDRTRTKLQWRQFAKTKISGITVNLFEEVWTTANLPDAWKKPGRPKIKSPGKSET